MLFRRPRSRIFRPEHVAAAHAFYERHGSKAMRFMPVMRTFVPVVAVSLKCRTGFAVWNVLGGASWVSSILVIGYFVGKTPLGKHVEAVILVIIFLSVLPGIVTAALAQTRSHLTQAQPSAARLQCFSSLVLRGVVHGSCDSAVAEVDDQADRQPDQQPPPVFGRQREHQQRAQQDADDRFDRHAGAAETAGALRGCARTGINTAAHAITNASKVPMFTGSARMRSGKNPPSTATNAPVGSWTSRAFGSVRGSRRRSCAAPDRRAPSRASRAAD